MKIIDLETAWYKYLYSVFIVKKLLIKLYPNFLFRSHQNMKEMKNEVFQFMSHLFLFCKVVDRKLRNDFRSVFF